MIVIDITIFNNTGMELTLDTISQSRHVQWTRGVEDVGQAIAAHSGLAITLEGPEDQPFSGVLRWAYPDDLHELGSFSTQVCRSMNGMPTGVIPLTDQTTSDAVSVNKASYQRDDRHWEVSFIVNVPPA